MIQLGSGVFECNINDKFVLSGEIRFLNNVTLPILTQEKSVNLDETSNDIFYNVSENEIYSILENNGFNLGFENITQLQIYKNKIQGSIKWENDWINFLEGLFKIPFVEHLGTGPIEIPVYIRELCINPALFENRLYKGTS